MKVSSILMTLGLFGVLTGCGSSEDPISMEGNFRADNTLSSSLFSQNSAAEDVPGTFRLLVVSDGVSSGFLTLNETELLGPSDFHNRSFQQVFEINLQEENTFEAELRGSPGDQLCVRFYEIMEDQSERGIFEDCLDRSAGPPNHVEVVVDPQDDTCPCDA